MYIGQKEVKEILPSEIKTPNGKDCVEVSYSDETKEVLPKDMADKLQSLEPRDATGLRDMRVAIMTQQIFAIMQDYGMKFSELAYLGSMILNSVEKNKEAAEKVLWQKSLNDITMVDIHNIVKEKPEVLSDILAGGQ